MTRPAALQTGLRLSEITGLKQQDMTLGTGAHVRGGGGFRERRGTFFPAFPFAALKAWIDENGSDGNARLFPSGRGTRLSADAVQHLVRKYAAAARSSCPSLARKRVTPHVLRHYLDSRTMLSRGYVIR
jgi:integrase